MLCIFEEENSIVVETKIQFLSRVFGKKHAGVLGVLFGVSQGKKIVLAELWAKGFFAKFAFTSSLC